MTAADLQVPRLTRRGALALAASTTLMPGSGQASPGIPAMGDLTTLYPTPDAWVAERAAVLGALPGLLAFKGRLGAGTLRCRAAAAVGSGPPRGPPERPAA